MLTIKDLVTAACLKLHTPAKLLDVEILLSMVLNKERVFIKTWPDYQITDAENTVFERLLARRIDGEPIAYIIGQCDFWDFTLQINNNVLVPRPETEHLVEVALRLIRAESTVVGVDIFAASQAANGEGNIRCDHILELGTGSGAIACALAKELPNYAITAVDSSAQALALAANNARYLGLNNINFLQGDWFSALTKDETVKIATHATMCETTHTALGQYKFSCIVSNPPYIAFDDPLLAKEVLQFEPQQALLAADAGYADLRHIINHAQKFLLASGWLVLEHGYNQGEGVQEMLNAAGFNEVFTTKDLAGKDRISAGRK